MVNRDAIAALPFRRSSCAALVDCAWTPSYASPRTRRRVRKLLSSAPESGDPNLCYQMTLCDQGQRFGQMLVPSGSMAGLEFQRAPFGNRDNACAPAPEGAAEMIRKLNGRFHEPPLQE